MLFLLKRWLVLMVGAHEERTWPLPRKRSPGPEGHPWLHAGGVVAPSKSPRRPLQLNGPAHINVSGSVGLKAVIFVV